MSNHRHALIRHAATAAFPSIPTSPVRDAFGAFAKGPFGYPGRLADLTTPSPRTTISTLA